MRNQHWALSEIGGKPEKCGILKSREDDVLRSPNSFRHLKKKIKAILLWYFRESYAPNVTQSLYPKS